MKTLKLITGIALMSIFALTSCQNEIEDVQGDNPNTANSTMATNLERVSMFDGSSDDLIDSTSCSSIKFPYVAKVNGVTVNLNSQLSFESVIGILGQLNNNEDTVEIQFPVTLKMSDYTEVTVTSQSQYDALVNDCQQAEDDSKDAISSLDIKFPITLLTFDSTLAQTGNVVVTSEQQLYTYMTNLSSSEYFSVKYPITVTLSDNSTVTINSDAEFKSSINAALDLQSKIELALENKAKLETILVNGTFKVNSFINAGVDATNNYVNTTIDFANDWKVKSMNTLTTIASGTYSVASDTSVYLEFTFAGSTNFSLFNNEWKVSSFTTSTITLQSTTNSAVTVVLKQI